MHKRERRERPRLWLVFLLVGVIAVGLLVHFRSSERLLHQELEAYNRSLREGNPRPQLVTRLSEDSIPILLKWLAQKDSPAETRLEGLLRKAEALIPPLEIGPPEYRIPAQDLALVGFDWLGTNAARAVPELAALAKRGGWAENAASALISMGPAAYETALVFADSPKIEERSLGAFLLGGLRLNPDRTVPILLQMATDEDSFVRAIAMNALAEFPSARVTACYLPRVRNPQTAHDAAYILQADTNALRRLLDAGLEATNRQVRTAVFAALAFRDMVPKIEGFCEPRHETYRRKRLLFDNKSLAIAWQMYRAPDDEAADMLRTVRSNLIATGRPDVDNVLRRREQRPTVQ